MTRLSTLILVAVLSALLSQQSARAQSSLEDIIKKTKVSREDQAVLEAEINNKAKQIIDATSAQTLAERRDFLIRLAKTSGATPAGLAALASAASDPLQKVATCDSFDAAFAAARVLVEIQHPNVAGSLTAALSSNFSAIRYIAAKGLKSLLPKLLSSPGDATSALNGLAQQGAAERDPVVLRMIYDAVDLHAAGTTVKNGDACAAVLATIFRGRLEALNSGSRDETRDLRGYAAAPACYEKADADGKNQLIAVLFAMLEYTVGRFFDPDTSVETRPRIADVIDKQEKIIRGMIKSSGVKEPAKTVSSQLKSGGDDAKQESAARAALEELHTLLRGDPWKLP